MGEQVLRGLAASPGRAAGVARVLDAPGAGNGRVLRADEREPEADLALGALAAAADEIKRIAAELINAADAQIVETGSLMAADPELAAAVRAAILESGLTAVDAIVQATSRYADTLAALDDELLRQRADDIRSLGRRAARIAAGGDSDDGASGDFVLVAQELGPADVAELSGSVRAIALAAGGTMAHAAIVARSLGIPMVVGVGGDLLAVGAGEPLVVDGDDGLVVAAPAVARLADAERAAERRARARDRSAAEHALPAVTRDGHRVRVLVNVAGPSEVGAGLASGAEGVGLFRTELHFLEARTWPSAEDHRRHAAAVLACLSGMTATVRLLDFGGDKTPPFLDGTSERGIALLLANEEALAAQVQAIVETGAHTRLRILLPMVETPEQVEAVRAAAPGTQIGAMIETISAVERVGEIAAAADFLSIGTNDLTHSVLASDRFAPGESVTHHPEVLRAVARVLGASGDRIVEICGEAASDPLTMPLLLGLGTDELSVGAASVGPVRSWVRALDYEGVHTLAQHALTLATPADVAELMRPVAELLAQLDDAPAERVDGSGGVVTVGGQP
jgi:phosphoenolpyruvate-protein kinase (PTS system EI component)